MNVEERERRLLALVQEFREQRCRAILAEAEARAAALRRQTYERQRAALHERVAAERARAQGLIQAAEAERATRLRRRDELRDAALVQAAWPLLERALAARWADTATRSAWVSAALDEAAQRLPRGQWALRHAPDWPAPEREEAARRLRADGIDVQFSADGGIAAGLVIGAGGALLDASLDGLLGDSERVQARLLALYKAQPDQAQADPGQGTP